MNLVLIRDKFYLHVISNTKIIMRRIVINYCFIISFLLSVTLSQAQNAILRTADKEYTKLKYSNAIVLYEEYLGKYKPVEYVYKNLGTSYYKIGDTKNAEKSLRRYLENQPQDTTALYQMAQSLAQNGKYEESNIFFTKYAKLKPRDSKAKAYMKDYEDVSALFEDSADYKLYFLNLNSAQSDFSPYLLKEKMIFVSARAPSGAVRSVFSWNNTPFLQLYAADTAALRGSLYNSPLGVNSDDDKVYSHSNAEKKLHYDETYITSNDTRTLGYYGHSFKNDSLTNTKNPVENTSFSKKINTKYHEGPLTFNPGGDTVYFTRNNFHKGRYKKSESGTNKLKIYYAVLNSQGIWSDVQEFPFNQNDYSTGHPVYDNKKNRLYFASDRPGGFGGTDIYYTDKKGAQWQTPVNLGNKINSSGNEFFPFYDQQNTLYYSSDGQGGLGGTDILYNNLSTNEASINPGFPVNSRNDDFGFVTNADFTKGYLSSNRKQNGYDDDIYQFTHDAGIRLFLHVYEHNSTLDTLDGLTVAVRDSATGEEILGLKKGNYTIYKLLPGKKYTTVVLGNDMYKGSEKTISTIQKTKELHSSLPVTTIEMLVAVDTLKKPSDCEDWKKKYSLPIVYYDLDKSFIRPDAALALDQAVKLLLAEPDLKLILSSHTDSRQTFRYNVALSQRRTASAFNYLVSKGISPDRFQKEYHSESELVNKCGDDAECTEAEHQFNRRTELYILKGSIDLRILCNGYKPR